MTFAASIAFFVIFFPAVLLAYYGFSSLFKKMQWGTQYPWLTYALVILLSFAVGYLVAASIKELIISLDTILAG